MTGCGMWELRAHATKRCLRSSTTNRRASRAHRGGALVQPRSHGELAGVGWGETERLR